MLKEYLNVFTIVYLNNILIFSETPKEHTEHIRKVLKACVRYNLKLKLSKYEFGIARTEFLRYIIILEKTEIDFKKVESILT